MQLDVPEGIRGLKLGNCVLPEDLCDFRAGVEQVLDDLVDFGILGVLLHKFIMDGEFSNIGDVDGVIIYCNNFAV